MEHSMPLTPEQFADVCRMVKTRFEGGAGDLRFKYIRPHYDVRLHHIYRVEFDGFTAKRVFDYRDEDDRSMYARIHEWVLGYPPGNE